MGPLVERFESEFAREAGTEHAVMVSSCTAALHLAFAGLGLGDGDEVIMPSLTFVATANAAAYTGARVRFADITSLDHPVMSADAAGALVGPRTAAICLVHYAGYVTDIEPFRELCRRHSLALIEDAAHAPGARSHDGRPAGSLGDAACFSFFSNKNLVTGEGGMLTTDDTSLAERARLLRAHGMSATTWDRERGHATGYDVTERGHNYRPSEIEAALGLVQLGKLADMTARRRALVARYRERLDPELGRVPFMNGDGRSACHILPFVCADGGARSSVREEAAARGIQTSVHYPPVHRFSVFGDQPALPVTEDMAEREVTLPLFADMSPSAVDLVVEAVNAGARPSR